MNNLKRIPLHLVLIGMIWTNANAIADQDPVGYLYVPSAERRSEANSGYLKVAEFPNLEIVKENEGTPNPKLINYFPEADWKSLFNKKLFTSLQVREMFIKADSISTGYGAAAFEFAVSVKHSFGSNTNPLNFNKGTIEVAGMIQIVVTNNRLSAKVVQFYDSQTKERLGRLLFGYNRIINLEFAQYVVQSTLEGYFNESSERIIALLKHLP